MNDKNLLGRNVFMSLFLLLLVASSGAVEIDNRVRLSEIHRTDKYLFNVIEGYRAVLWDFSIFPKNPEYFIHTASHNLWGDSDPISGARRDGSGRLYKLRKSGNRVHIYERDVWNESKEWIGDDTFWEPIVNVELAHDYFSPAIDIHGDEAYFATLDIWYEERLTGYRWFGDLYLYSINLVSSIVTYYGKELEAIKSPYKSLLYIHDSAYDSGIFCVAVHHWGYGMGGGGGGLRRYKSDGTRLSNFFPHPEYEMGREIACMRHPTLSDTLVSSYVYSPHGRTIRRTSLDRISDGQNIDWYEGGGKYALPPISSMGAEGHAWHQPDYIKVFPDPGCVLPEKELQFVAKGYIIVGVKDMSWDPVTYEALGEGEEGSDKDQGPIDIDVTWWPRIVE